MHPAVKGKLVFRWQFDGVSFLAVYQLISGIDLRLRHCFNGVAGALLAIMREGDRAPRASVLGPPGPFERFEAIVVNSGPDWIQVLLVVPISLRELERHVRVDEDVVDGAKLVIFRTELINSYTIVVADVDLEVLLESVPEPEDGGKDAIIARGGTCAFRTAEAGLRRHGPLSGLVVVALLAHFADQELLHELLPVDVVRFWNGSEEPLPRIIDLDGESIGIVLPRRGVSHREVGA